MMLVSRASRKMMKKTTERQSRSTKKSSDQQSAWTYRESRRGSAWLLAVSQHSLSEREELEVVGALSGATSLSSGGSTRVGTVTRSVYHEMVIER